ncbi:MAG: polymer-forming cytoskeletal protein [Proteobacteria bacterium]|nr:polymer-forming cytoskeletal protein [Pseudomonadota bacterium]
MKWFSKLFSDSSSDNSSGELNAFLGTGTRFTGHLHFEGSVRIDGNFQGNITSPGTLILGREAVIKGEIEVSSLNANGTVIGTVRATRHVHLHENAVVDGLLVTPTLGIDEGAIVNGSIEMRPPSPVAEASAGALDTQDVPYLPNSSARPAISIMPDNCCTEASSDAAQSQNEDGG